MAMRETAELGPAFIALRADVVGSIEHYRARSPRWSMRFTKRHPADWSRLRWRQGAGAELASARSMGVFNFGNAGGRSRSFGSNCWRPVSRGGGSVGHIKTHCQYYVWSSAVAKIESVTADYYLIPLATVLSDSSLTARSRISSW